MRPLKQVGDGAVATLAALTVQPPAAAQAPAPPAFGFALAAPGSRTYFRLTASRGRAVTGTLVVVNRLERSETVKLGAANVTTASLGGPAYGPGLTRRRSGWSRLSTRELRFAGDASVDVPFFVHIPRHATAGQRYPGIVAVPERAPRQRAANGRISLRLVTRLAMTVEVSRPGRRARVLRVGAAGFLSAPAGAFLTLHPKKAGHTLIQSATADVSVGSHNHRLFGTKVDLGPFVSRTAISLHIPWRARLRPGRYEIGGVLHPDGQRPLRFRRTLTLAAPTVSAAAEVSPSFAASGSDMASPASATPLKLALAGLGLLLAAVTAGWLRDRRHRQLQPGRHA